MQALAPHRKRFWTRFEIHCILYDLTWGACPRDLTSLTVAGLFGLGAMVSAPLGRTNVVPDEPHTHKRTPMSWAAEMGQVTVDAVRLLVDHPGVTPTQRTTDGAHH